MINKQYQKLCIKEITGNITGNERLVLDSWLADSIENRNEFEKLKETWSASGLNEFPQLFNIDTEWAKLNERLRNLEKPEFGESFFEKLFPLRVSVLKPAIVSVFILGIIALGILFLTRDVAEPRLNVISTSNNEYKNIKLPDGSVVFLNGGSSIKFLLKSEGEKKDFSNGERKISLTGEAFFSVAKNKNPFIITTENAKITVLGTKFDVLSRNENTRVVVKEGRVSFSPKDINSKGIYLVKDQLSTISKNSEPTLPKEVDAGYFLGWMKGNLVFYRTPVKEIVTDLEKRYNINISFQADSLITNTLTGSFKNGNADSAVSMVCMALGLDFEKQNENYIIKTKDLNQ
ncbi:MAG: FecR domain-containing protein [Ignavibacteriaceae bacterium]